MDKLYSCTGQGRTLLFTLVMLLLTSLSMQSFAQSSCLSPVVRQATSGKSTNTNVYDDIAIAMTKLLGDGTEAAWVMESGGTFTENPDGTARFVGVVKQFGDYAVPRRLALDILLGGKSFSPDATGPYNQTGVATSGWYYYYTLSGSMTGLDALAGGKLNLAIHMHPFQVGIGANQLFNAEDQVSNGAGGWFEWTVATQPTNTALQFTNYIPGLTVSDIAILLSGTPSVPCTATGSIGDQLYEDVNNNGVFDANDAVVTGLTVTLCDANGVTISTQTVGTDGKYLFTMLAAGVYNVKFPATTLNGKPQRNTGAINVNLAAGQNYLDADKGYYQTPATGSIGDQLYEDLNNNGVFDANDAVVTGLIVTLCDANGVTISTQTVGTDGKYLFTNLAAGVYNVKFPATTLNGKPQRNTGAINVNLAAGQNYLDADKGYYQAAVDPCLNDVEVPTLSNCPKNIIKDITSTTGTCGSITWTAPTATDNCSTPVVTSNYSSSYCFPVGVTTVTYTATDAKGNVKTCSFAVNIIKSNSCNVTGNTISKSCVNNIPVVTGTALANYEYLWLKSTTSCPTLLSQAIVGANTQNYSLPSRVSVTTYFVRCARPVGCTIWGPVNESNCVTVNPSDCGDPCANFNVSYTTGTCNAAGEYIPIFTFTGRTGSVYITMGSWYGTATGNTYTMPKAVTGATTFTFKDLATGCTKTVSIANPCPNPCGNFNVSYTTGVCNVLGEYIPTFAFTGKAGNVYITMGAWYGTATGNTYTMPKAVTGATTFTFKDLTTGCTKTVSIANPCQVVNPCANFNVTYTSGTCNSLGAYTPTFTFTGRTGSVYITMGTWYATATSNTYTMPKTVAGATIFTFKDLATGCTKTVTIANPCPKTTTGTCSANFSSLKSYRIVNKKSGKVLDVSGAGTTNDCPIIQWGYHGGTNQQWRLFSLSNGAFKVMARNSSKYLACHNTSSGSQVYQYDYYSGGYKDWKIECVGNTGYYRLVHGASGKVLDVANGSISDGAKMQINTWNGGDCQLFKIEEVTPGAGVYSLTSSALNLNATAESDRVRLGWLTNTGYDNDFYTVEKMNQSTGDFEKMSLINNTQYDDQVQAHVAFDGNPTEGDNFYRVKVTKNDGAEKLTDVKKVTFKRIVGFGAFPNPATSELNVNLSEYTGKAVDIQLYNAFGKVMSNQHIDNVSNAVIQLDVNDFAAGQYLIRVSSEGKRDATQQVVIQK
jgi:hypothetical protein